MAERAPIAIQAKVLGRVQGVAFRAWARSEALRLELDGWVRNNADGSVSARFAGPAERVETMAALLWKGPTAASVTDVRLEAVDPASVPPGFEIAR